MIRRFRNRTNRLKKLLDTRCEAKGYIVHKNERHVRENLLSVTLINSKNLLKALHDLLLVLGRNRLEHNTPIFSSMDGFIFIHVNSLYFPFELMFYA